VTEPAELTGALERESAQRLATVSNRLDALRRLLDAGKDRVDDRFLAPGHRLLERSGERLQLSTVHTVVALVGATGSGKSSLFNALSGLELSAVGVRRPTTSLPHACIWGPEGADDLLDWLSIVPRNRAVRESELDADEQADLRGLVLLDLPDHDSTNVTHRLEVDRMIGLVDLLVWVLDPQKYADAAIHQRYLREMANHEQATVVLLNQIDTLEPADVGACLQDVRRLLHEDGLSEVALLPVSARTGAGLDEVRKLFAAAIAERRTAVDRISADLDRVATALGSLSGPAVPEEVDRPNQNAVVDDLAQAAGIPALAEEVHGGYLWRAGRLTGWTFARLVGRLRPDPRSAAERELGNGRAGASGGVVVPRAIGRAEVDGALRALSDRLTATMPPAWHPAISRATRVHADDVQPALDQVLSETDLGLEQQPRWWRLLWLVQWLLALVAVVGGAGLIVNAVQPHLLAQVPAMIRQLVPAAMLGGGLLLGLLLALVTRSMVRTGARRAQARVTQRLRDGVVAAVREYVVGPIRAELTAYATAQDAYQVLTHRSR
jgi:GTP-binding protein EngB required for normal cell division